MGGKMTAYAAAKPPQLDGDLGDWACVPFYSLTGANAQSDGYPAASISATFALQWTPSTLYVAVRVNNGTPPSGTDGVVYNNESVEVYFGQDDATTGTFRTNDHHYIVDYKNYIEEFRDTGQPQPVSASAVVSATKTQGTQYVVELSVTAATLGHNALPGEIPFDLQVNQVAVGAITSKLIWFLATSTPTSSSCSGNQEVYCNSNLWGRLKMGP
jgi:hypothetical protein